MNWSREDLAASCNMSAAVVRKYELGMSVSDRTLEAFELAFSQHGITFTKHKTVETVRHDTKWGKEGE